jgi:hypothetical protein
VDSGAGDDSASTPAVTCRARHMSSIDADYAVSSQTKESVACYSSTISNEKWSAMSEGKRRFEISVFTGDPMTESNLYLGLVLLSSCSTVRNLVAMHANRRDTAANLSPRPHAPLIEWITFLSDRHRTPAGVPITLREAELDRRGRGRRSSSPRR